MSFLAGEVGAGDVCISMGCGDIASLPDEVLARRAPPEPMSEPWFIGGSATWGDRTAALVTARRAGRLGAARDVRAGADDDVPRRRRGGAVRRRARLDDLAAVAAAPGPGLPVLVVGRGSNLLVADAGFAGIAVSIADLAGDIDIDG